MVRPVLILEINEVPWRVFDLYLQKGRLRSIDQFFSRAATYTSVAVDSGELSPWVTWPSLHRGMSSDKHGIKNLGQDPKTFHGTAIWEEYRKRQYNIGVFGSLQSWPPVDPGLHGFYIPDTFAHDADTIPPFLRPLQEWNLSLVKENGRVVRDKPLIGTNKSKIILSLLRARPSVKTLWRIAKQIVAERFNKNRLARRPVFQTVLFWDIFKRLYKPSAPPYLSTFFTNHIAGLMHRYWNELFPEDFHAVSSHPHLGDFNFSMTLLDEMIGDALEFQRRRPDLIVVLATSMGQGPVHRESHEGVELSVNRIDKLMLNLGFTKSDYKPLLAMVPQIALESPDQQILQKIRNAVEELKTASGQNLFRCETHGKSLSISIVTPSRADIEKMECHNETKAFTWSSLGIEVLETESGTGYHIPEGVLAVVGQGLEPTKGRTKVQASEIKSMIQNWSGL